MEDALQGIELLMSIKKISLGIDGVVDWGVAQNDLTPSQGFLLVYIWNYHQQGTFVTDIHRELGVSKATVSGLIKKLRQKGYLSVEEVPDDDRHKKIVITKKLQTEAGYLTEQMSYINRRIYRDMGPEDMEVLLKLLCQVLKNLKRYHQNHRIEEEPDHDYDSETNQAI